MTRMIFINLPVRDLTKSVAFYEALGFENEPRFTDDTAAAMRWSDSIMIMILTHEKWKSFTDRPIPDSGSSEVLLCVSLDSRDEVFRIWARTGFPFEVWKEDYEGEPLRVRFNPQFDPFLVARYKDAVEQAVKFKLTRSKFEVDGWIDQRYLNAALKGPYRLQ